MDCPYKDTKCYFANDRRYWDAIDINRGPLIELGTIECELPENETCPREEEPECEEEDPAHHGPDIN